MAAKLAADEAEVAAAEMEEKQRKKQLLVNVRCPAPSDDTDSNDTDDNTDKEIPVDIFPLPAFKYKIGSLAVREIRSAEHTSTIPMVFANISSEIVSLQGINLQMMISSSQGDKDLAMSSIEALSMILSNTSNTNPTPTLGSVILAVQNLGASFTKRSHMEDRYVNGIKRAITKYEMSGGVLAFANAHLFWKKPNTALLHTVLNLEAAATVYNAAVTEFTDNERDLNPASLLEYYNSVNNSSNYEGITDENRCEKLKPVIGDPSNLVSTDVRLFLIIVNMTLRTTLDTAIGKSADKLWTNVDKQLMHPGRRRRGGHRYFSLDVSLTDDKDIANDKKKVVRRRTEAMAVLAIFVNAPLIDCIYGDGGGASVRDFLLTNSIDYSCRRGGGAKEFLHIGPYLLSDPRTRGNEYEEHKQFVSVLSTNQWLADEDEDEDIYVAFEMNENVRDKLQWLEGLYADELEDVELPSAAAAAAAAASADNGEVQLPSAAAAAAASADDGKGSDGEDDVGTDDGRKVAATPGGANGKKRKVVASSNGGGGKKKKVTPQKQQPANGRRTRSAAVSEDEEEEDRAQHV